MDFVENKGQWHSSVKYIGDFNTGSFVLEDQGFSVILHKAEDMKRISERLHGHESEESAAQFADKDVLHSFVYQVKLLGSTKNPFRETEKPSPGKINYMLGNDRSKWASGCSAFQAVTYRNVYPNIDMRYYSDKGQLKYDFIVSPGGNPGLIALRYDGPKSLDVKDKELVISTPVGEVKELYPYSYQPGTGKRQEVDVRYVVKDNIVSFDIKKYDPSLTLVIDPSIIFSSFTGSRADNWGFTATPGPDGSLIAGGIVFANPPTTFFPVSPGAYQTTYGGGNSEGPFAGYDMAIFKFSPDGSSRVFATYLGGSGNEQPHSMICDPQGNLVIAGRSNSSNYPVSFNPPNNPRGGYDIVVTKLSANGANLIGSVRIGGTLDDGVNIKPKYPQVSPSAISLRRNYGDDARSEVILDAANNIYLASCTQSNNFPVMGSAIQTTFGGGLQDGLILKFNSNLNSVLFSTYFGGNGDDACFVASINPVTNDLYVAGGTASSTATLPGNKAGVITPAFQGGVADGFVTQVRNDGSSVIRTTFLGTTGIDLVYGLKFDRKGYPYVMGTTTGSWTITANAVFRNPGSKQFISKLQPDLSAYVYSTVFGTASPVPNISPVAFLVDRCENVYVSGWGGGINVDQGYSTGSTSGLPMVDPLPGIPAPDGRDFYFFVLEKNATRQLFGSHYGQNGGLGDHVDGGTSRFDENGVIYQAICANCGNIGNFPTTPGVWAASNGSTSCNQAAIKIEMNYSGVGAGVQASINSIPNDSTGCVPLTVNFRDTLLKGKKYYWDFGDSPNRYDTTLGATSSHTFNVAGVYRVMLIAEDSATCNIRDTAYVTIRAGNNRATPDFTFAKIGPCESLTMEFTNTSTFTTGSFGPRSFVWDYGDGTPPDTAAFAPPRVHTYAVPGNYTVKLHLIDTSFCNSPSVKEKTVRLNPIVDAGFTTDSVGCVPFTAKFRNTSLGGTDFVWDFGDNQTSTEEHPTHVYNTPGDYTVTLTATDTSTCNRVDTYQFTVRVVPIPTAGFTWDPNPPTPNTPTRFTNTSTGASTYLWNFGDGESSTEFSPSHQYNETGTYLAELIAFNEAGCPDTFRLDVEAIVNPLLDVPNAFTPGRFGENAFVNVRGFGIGKMEWRIYNRWGQVVFISNSLKTGWDGTYKGKAQPMDVYAYTLDVEFTDGKKLRKTGDITLIR